MYALIPSSIPSDIRATLANLGVRFDSIIDGGDHYVELPTGWTFDENDGGKRIYGKDGSLVLTIGYTRVLSFSLAS